MPAIFHSPRPVKKKTPLLTYTFIQTPHILSPIGDSRVPAGGPVPWRVTVLGLVSVQVSVLSPDNCAKMHEVGTLPVGSGSGS